MSTKKNEFIKGFSYVLIFVIVLCVVGFVAFFTHGFDESFKRFYVTIDGQTYTTSENAISLDYGKDYLFSCKYVFEDFDEEEKGYSVKVVPSQKGVSNFSFTVDGEEKSYWDIEELTVAFEITKEESCFFFKIPEGFTIKKCLEALYPDSLIEIPNLCDTGLYYTLVVSSYDNSITYNFHFGTYVLDIYLNKGVIAFWLL